MNLDDLGDHWTSFLRSNAPATFARVVRDGQEFQPIRRPKDFRKMKDKACFRNATMAVMDRPDSGLRYAEGFAQNKFGWVHHAWVVDADGNAIDVTWRDPGFRYIGVALDIVEVSRMRADERAWGSVFDVW